MNYILSDKHNVLGKPSYRLQLNFYHSKTVLEILLYSISAPKPDFYHVIHDGPVNTVQRSPFFKDIVLCVGGWSFTVWKEGITVSLDPSLSLYS